VKGYAGTVTQALVRLLLLCSVLLMPFGMAPVAANGTGHAHSMATMQMGHCGQQPKQHGMKSGFAECTMACSAALPASDRPHEDLPPVVTAHLEAARPAILHGLHPETATPPPRLS